MQNVLIGMTGSIGMLNMPSLLQMIRPQLSNVRVIMTRSAREFIPAETMELVAGPVYGDLFPLGSTPREWCHVQMSRWADLIVVLPATANIIAQTAHGMSDSLLSSTILCSQHPVVFFPNMNTVMWNNPATQRNVALCKEYGHRIVPPVEQEGFEYASGEIREGLFMPAPETILETIFGELHQRSEETVLEEAWMEQVR